MASFTSNASPATGGDGSGAHRKGLVTYTSSLLDDDIEQLLDAGGKAAGIDRLSALQSALAARLENQEESALLTWEEAGAEQQQHPSSSTTVGSKRMTASQWSSAAATSSELVRRAPSHRPT